MNADRFINRNPVFHGSRIIRATQYPVPLLIIFLSIVVQPDQTLIKDYQRQRIMSFLYPENDEYSDDIQQQNNSKTAIASGELIGKKLSGNDEVASVNEGNFVAENQTDFIFAVAGEEYGFIGCTAIVILLLLISIECIRMSLRAKDLAGKILCCGVGSVVAIQSFLNICVATGLAPNTGTPLPFVSYGLTSLISLFMGMGLVLNVGLQSSAYNKELPCLCLTHYESDKWNSSIMLTESYIPWAIEWTEFYELWLLTGIWYGGGVHPGGDKENE